MKPHKHAELIKAWADGAEIEVKTNMFGWATIDSPTWAGDAEYRIKPKPKHWYENIPPQGILCWVWDGEETKKKYIVQIVLRKGESEWYVTQSNWWSNATPLTRKEALNLVWQGEQEEVL